MFKFLKKDAVRLVLYSFVVACLVVILGLSQLIVSFDSSLIIEKELKNTKNRFMGVETKEEKFRLKGERR